MSKNIKGNDKCFMCKHELEYDYNYYAEAGERFGDKIKPNRNIKVVLTDDKQCEVEIQCDKCGTICKYRKDIK